MDGDSLSEGIADRAIDSVGEITAQLAFPDVLQDACAAMTRALGGFDSILLLYDDLAGSFSVVWSMGRLHTLVGEVVAGEGAASLMRLLAERRAIIGPTLRSALESIPATIDAAFEGSPILLIPLRVTAPVGVLALCRSTQAFTDDWLTEAEQLGEEAARRIREARPDIGHHCLFRRILDVDPGGIAVVEGPHHVFSYAALAHRQMLDKREEPFLGRPIAQVLAEREGQILTPLLDLVRATGEPHHQSTFEVADQYGSRYYEFHLIPEKDLSGRVRAIFVILWPRTEVVLTRQALESTILKLAESQSLLSAVLDNTNNGIFFVGADLTVLYANRRMGEMLGISTRDVIGKNKRQVTEEELAMKVADPDGYLTRLNYLYDHPDETAIDEVEVRYPTRRVLERYSAPVYNDGGTLLGRIEVYSDVTEVRALQQNKDDFLSLVSHELKTPVTSIKGYAQLLQRRRAKEQLPEQTVQAYSIIERQAARMQELIDMLLDLSRIETRRLTLRLGEVNLSELVSRVAEMVQMTTEAHRIALQLPAQPTWIRADERRLEQVVMNLLTNAVRYSPEGGTITVGVQPLDEGARVSVSDQGVGIPTDALSRVFERFYRASGSQSLGMGIGLYITRGIVEEHGGTIDVVSEVGKGSTFTVTLPEAAPEPAAEVL